MEDWKEIIRIVQQLVRKITNKILEVNGLIIQCLAAFEICEVLQKYLLASLSMQVNDIQSDGYLHLMNDNNGVREDLKLPENDVGKEIRSKHENGEIVSVTVLSAMGEEMVIGSKVVPLTK